MNDTVKLDIPASAAERLARSQKQSTELTLLLTVSRVLRAKIRNEIYAEQEDDLWALHEALAPFDAQEGAPFSAITDGATELQDQESGG